jgi:hypothetical protein
MTPVRPPSRPACGSGTHGVVERCWSLGAGRPVLATLFYPGLATLFYPGLAGSKPSPQKVRKTSATDHPQSPLGVPIPLTNST